MKNLLLGILMLTSTSAFAIPGVTPVVSVQCNVNHNYRGGPGTVFHIWEDDGDIITLIDCIRWAQEILSKTVYDTSEPARYRHSQVNFSFYQVYQDGKESKTSGSMSQEGANPPPIGYPTALKFEFPYGK